MKKRLGIIYSTNLNDDFIIEYNKHIVESCGLKNNYVIHPIKNNGEYSLSGAYNKAIKYFKEGENFHEYILVFIHHDLQFKTNNWGRILLNRFNNLNYQIIGVAGSTFMPESGMWWEDRSKMVGIVEHSNEGKTWASEYSEEAVGKIKPVVTIDGLFMAIDCNEIDQYFDENYKGFHFYDLSMVFPNYLDGFNVGVTTDIRILHKSIGMTNEQWEENRKQFAYQYKDDLPVKHISEDRLKVLICCQFFNKYTGSEVSVYELSKELAKTCDVTIISSVVGDPLLSKARKNGVEVFSYHNLPNYVLNHENKFQYVKNQRDFDVIHINHKPIGSIMLQLYPNTPAVMHVRSEVIPTFEEPIIHPQIKRYISIRDSITEYIKSFGVEENKIELIDNPFDYTRFNTNYVSQKNNKEIILFVGTLDHLRKNILFDLKNMAKENNQFLWIVGADTGGYVNDLIGGNKISDTSIRYFGVKSNVEDYVKKCDYTAGIFKGRTTIEGFLCGKAGWIYEVDKQGNILTKTFTEVPEDVEKYRSDVSAKKIHNLYDRILNE